MNRARALLASLPALVLIAPACKSKPKGPDIPKLMADLRSADQGIRGQASLAIVRVGEPAVPALIEMLKSPEPAHRTTAASTLFGMGYKAREAAPALGEALADPEVDVRMGSAMALESIGPDAAPAVPALVKALKDREGVVRQRAAIALGSIGPAAQGAVPALVEAARWDPVRPAADEAIKKIRGR
jgi:HEAT repeat protein